VTELTTANEETVDVEGDGGAGIASSLDFVQ
jgi:hypothetical protein